MTPRWTKAIALVAEATAQAFLRSQSESRARMGAYPPCHRGEPKRGPRGDYAEGTEGRDVSRVGFASLLSRVRSVLDDSSRKYCDVCFPDRREAIVANFASAGSDALAKRRAERETDPAHTIKARRKQGVRAAENVRAIRDWDQKNRSTESAFDFERDILPKLQSVPLSRIMQATGLSLRYCSLIRRQDKTPHQRHWEALARLCEQH